MKVNYLLTVLLVTNSVLNAMEAPSTFQKQRLGQTVPSLKEIIVDQIATKINSLAEFNEQMAKAKLPQDLYCSVIRLIIKKLNYETTKFTITDLRYLIDHYCTDKFALKAFTYFIMMYSRAGLAPIRENLENIKLEANKVRDRLGYDVASSILEAQVDSPLTEALRHNTLDAAEFFISMGLKPSHQDLFIAVENNNIHIIQLLLNSGVPVDDPQSSTINQALWKALINADENSIQLLMNAGASLTKKYKTPDGGIDSLANYLRTGIRGWLARPPELQTLNLAAGETLESVINKMHKTLSLIDEYEKLEKEKPTTKK